MGHNQFLKYKQFLTPKTGPYNGFVVPTATIMVKNGVILGHPSQLTSTSATKITPTTFYRHFTFLQHRIVLMGLSSIYQCLDARGRQARKG